MSIEESVTVEYAGAYLPLPVRLVIPNVRPQSWNDYWSQKVTSARRAELAAEAKLHVRSIIDPQIVQMWPCPVKLIWTVYFDKQPLDASNICLKPFEDGLIGWIIKDDSPEWVTEVTVRSRVDKEEPRIELQIKSDPEITQFIQTI
jgi:hypothetical protein